MKKVNELDILGIVAAEVRLKQMGEADHLIGDVGENEQEFQKRYGEMKKLRNKRQLVFLDYNNHLMNFY